MTFKSFLTRPNYPALGLSVVCFLLLSLVVAHSQHGPPFPIALLLLTVCAPAVLLGIAAKRAPLIHGMLLSAVLFLFAGALAGLPRGLFGPLAFIALIVLCSLGSVIGDFIGRKVRGL